MKIEKPDYLTINVKAVIKMLTNHKYFFFMKKYNFIINKCLKRISNQLIIFNYRRVDVISKVNVYQVKIDVKWLDVN